MTDSRIKKYTLIDWTKMVPGEIIGGLITTDRGVGLASGWHPNTRNFKTWKRFCLSENILNLKDSLPVTMLSKTGVSVYCTNTMCLNELLFDSNRSTKKVSVPVEFCYGEPIGIFLGGVLKTEEEMYINFLTLDGKDVWISIIFDRTSQQG